MVQQLLKGAVAKSEDKDNQVAIYFDIIQEHSITMTSQITDNWMENNTVINDHIANQPLTVGLRGLSGEVVYVPSTTNGVLNTLYNAANSLSKNTAIKTDKLGVIAQLIPPVDNITQLAKNAITYVEASYKRYDKIISNFLSPTAKQTRLKTIYQKLSNAWETKTAFVVETPYSTFDNMYIQSLILRQDNQEFITDIEISMKQVNFTDTLTTAADEAVLAKYNGYQRAEVSNKGKVQGITPSKDSVIGSLIYKATGSNKYKTYGN